MSRVLNIGVMGFGYIGRIHVNAYRSIPLCFPATGITARMSALLRSQNNTDEFLQNAGFGLVTTNQDEFFSTPLDMVDICTPNHLHKNKSLAAINKGIPVYCEKPLACSLTDVRLMAEAAEENGVLTHTAFVLRYLPAVRQIKSLLESDALGEIFNFRAHTFHSSYLDRNRPMSWRLRLAESGGGAFADLGSHLVDLIYYLLGPTNSVRAKSRTFIKERPISIRGNDFEKVDVDDWMLCTMELQCGAVGSIEVTRMGAGMGDETILEIFGSKGAAILNTSQPDAVLFFDATHSHWINGSLVQDSPQIQKTVGITYPVGKFSQGLMTNLHLASIYDFLQCIVEGKPSQLGFNSVMAVHEIIEAAYFSAMHNEIQITLPFKP